MHDVLNDEKDNFGIKELEVKILTASCHKRRQGYVRKLHKHVNNAEITRDKRGLERCTILDTSRAQNDTGATHNITNNKHALVKF